MSPRVCFPVYGKKVIQIIRKVRVGWRQVPPTWPEPPIIPHAHCSWTQLNPITRCACALLWEQAWLLAAAFESLSPYVCANDEFAGLCPTHTEPVGWQLARSPLLWVIFYKDLVRGRTVHFPETWREVLTKAYKSEGKIACCLPSKIGSLSPNYTRMPWF